MADQLKGRTIAILATDGFEQVELTEPKKALESEGATVHVVSPRGNEGRTIRGWDEGDWGDEVDVDVSVKQADPETYDALVLPGGVINPDRLRRDRSSVRFVRAFFDADKPVAAICHGPWMLAEAGVAEGRKLTSFHSIRTDLENAGAEWVDQEVVEDGNLVTSRNPDDIPAFNQKVIEILAGRSGRRTEGRSRRERAGVGD